MTHTYQVTGMTCANCETNVKSSLLSLPDVTSVEVSKDTSTATITMNNHIPISELQNSLGGNASKYKISAVHHSESVEQAGSWVRTYKPLLILGLIITAISIIAAYEDGIFNAMLWMQYFMAAFFLSFSYFKLINLSGFAETYAMYDVVAKRLRIWGFIYPFIELLLGFAYMTGLNPVITNAATFIVMTVSLAGVAQSVLSKRKIKCACLGTVFNLPMSTVTIVEDVLMILMSAGMLLVHI
jgi:copper chaperone CopZ